MAAIKINKKQPSTLTDKEIYEKYVFPVIFSDVQLILQLRINQMLCIIVFKSRFPLNMTLPGLS